MMPTRRFLLFAPAAVLLASNRPARADSTDQAVAFITQLGKELLVVVNGAASVTEKQAALVKIVERDVDVPAVAQFCLGRFWRTATPAQQADYGNLFNAVLVKNITGKVGDYKGVSFAVTRGQPRDGDVVVGSLVTQPGNPPAKVDWIVSMSSGRPRVVDVMAEGTSLRLTQRSDYASFLSSHGNSVQALIDAMRQRAAAPG